MKKKRQSEPCGDIDNESTESCDDNQNKTSCSHTLKAVDLSKVKKALKGGLDVECADCLKSPTSTAEPDDGFEYDLKLWLCLKCGNQGCGRLHRKHALNHFLKPHSDSHALCVNTTTWQIWCYECDSEILPNSKKKLLEAYEYIKRQQPTPKNSPRIEPVPLETATQEEKLHTPSDVKTSKLIANLPRVRGLTNLGNTCFFNAVLQCLAQTPFLLSVLKEMSIEGEKFRLPGGTFKYKDKTEELPPIEGELAAWGPLTETLANTLEELQVSGGVYTPKKLLSLLAQKMPQFGGGDQEDSHELLRHLLEAVRTEDLKRYQRVILRDYGIPKLRDPASIDEETTQKLKFYGLQASEMMLRPEHVFRGVLVSTLQCQDCLHTSTREESFLDLSLPIMPDKPQPPIMRRKSELEEENKPSKHQLKKEKKAARKAARQKKPVNKVINQNDGEPITEENQVDNSGESEQSDADVEDNLEDATKILSTPDDKSDCNLSEKVDLPEKTDKSPSTETSTLNDVNLKFSMGYQYYNHVNSVKNEVDDHEKTESKLSNDDKSANLKDFANRLSAGCTNIKYDNKIKSFDQILPASANVSPNSSEYSDLSSPDQLQTTESRNEVSQDEISSTGVANKSTEPAHDTQTKQSSPTNTTAPDADEKPKIIALGWHEAERKPKSPVKDIFSYNVPAVLPSSYIEDNRNFYLSSMRDTWSSTVGARYQCDEGECSIQSCLNQFTSVELMTGNNKVCCEACTKRINGKDGKNVYTNSTKQLLIASPPAVLILHLKRFQVFRSLFRKMSKPVTFPLVLDLAPFCSNKCKNLPSINHQQNRLLYSLYGVVEHSGTLHGGHYVAYVKVRPPLDENDYRWQFLPRNGSKTPTLSNCNDLSSPTLNNVKENNEKIADNFDGAAGITEPDVPPGKWYYVSDSQVSEVPENRVLKAQAYLLFYERIL